MIREPFANDLAHMFDEGTVPLMALPLVEDFFFADSLNVEEKTFSLAFKTNFIITANYE